ncbi:MAG: long-chain fatty acid--CoA ligase [Anaerolineae bacterium]|nr:long-chain fatty acid--CoA ligase [Anaerolineae bacterium]
MVTYADRPWVKRYDPSVPPSLEPYPRIPLFQLLTDSARKVPNNVALVTSAHLPVLGRVGSELTYAQVDQSSDAFAAALIDLGLKKGDRVAIVMPNIAAFIIVYFGILKAGGVVAATNPTYPAEKMREQFNDSNAKIVVTMTLFYKTVKQAQAAGSQVETVIATSVKEYLPPLARVLFTLAREKKDGHFVESLPSGDYWLQDLLMKYTGKKSSVEVSGDDLAIFQYTGGTTGIPKAAMSTHNALVANTLQCRAWLIAGGGDGSDQIFLGAIPFYHVYGLITVVGFAMALGARIVLVPNARDIPDLLDIIGKYTPTIFMGVPALYNAVNNNPSITSGKISLSTIRLCLSGSAPLPPATKREFERLSGGKLLEGFGMSEAPTASHANPVAGENRTGSIGLPFPDMDMKIVSLDDGETEVPVGEIGELAMAGPQLMIGYHGMPTETSNALRKDQNGKTWLYTGDIARMDEDGYFYIVDRKKDMALIGGFNVYPNAVEKVLADHPAVLEAGVAAIPHPDSDKVGQEALKAWIVLRPGQSVTSEELIEFASTRLARFEVPSRYAFVEALPKTNVGKTLRRELVQMEMADREKS